MTNKIQTEPLYSYRNNESLTPHEMNVFIETNACPDCGGKLMEGSCGGGSENLNCKDCHAGFNYMGPLGMDRISDRTMPPKESK